MDKVGCCLRDSLGREVDMANKVEQLENTMHTKR